MALQQAIAEAREGDTVQGNSPAYNLQSNSGAEKAVQHVTDLMRRILLSLEAKVRKRLDLSLPWARWLVRHAVARYQVGTRRADSVAPRHWTAVEWLHVQLRREGDGAAGAEEAEH